MKNMIIRSNRTPKGLLLSDQGSILVYIVLTMVIFGILGVTMVSLFSSSISSSATQNDTRRATYLSESGRRYAMSELLSVDFNNIDNLNNTVYKVDKAGEFRLNIFTPSFEPDSMIDLPANFSNQRAIFKAKNGNIPIGLIYGVPTTAPFLELVNLDYFNLSGASNPQASAKAVIVGATPVSGFPKNIEFLLSDDNDGDGFVAIKDKPVTFAVKPFADQTVILQPDGILLLEAVASKIFPARNGSFDIKSRRFYYEKAIDHSSYVELTGVRPISGESSNAIDVTTTDYVILADRNYIVISEGNSNDVTFGNRMDYADAISKLSPEKEKPDIEFDRETDLERVLSRVEQSLGNVVNIGGELGNRFVTLSASGGSFGAFWFRDPDSRSIGGVRNFCNNLGGCLFNDGFRAFFILNFTGSSSGDGLAFGIVNASNNTAASIGGDIDLSELLAYAGDSRKISNPTLATHFLDGRSGQGLNAPKFAAEFDGLENNQFATICEDGSTPNIGTRNDPDVSGASRDTVQYVFWGSNNTLINAPCRINTLLDPDTNKTYDDNRHDAVNAIWIYDSGAQLVSSPAVDDRDLVDIKIYAGLSRENTQNDGGRIVRLRASDGSLSSPGWTQNPDDTPGNDDDINSSPALDSSNPSHIYIGTDSFIIAKYNSNGSRIWRTFLDGNIEGKPAVSNPKNRLYVVTDNGSLWAINTSDGTPAWAAPVSIGSSAGGYDYTSSPTIGLGPDSKNVIYVGTRDNQLVAVIDDGTAGTEVFRFDTFSSGSIRSTPAINPVTGDIYFGSDDNKIYAIRSTGNERFPAVLTGGDVVSSPAVTGDGRKIYVGSNDGRLYIVSLNADGTLNTTQTYPPSGNSPIGGIRSAPTIANDGAVVFGSDDGHLYALNPDGTLRWKYPAAGSIGAVRSKPAIGPDGVIYFGANDGKLYAIDPAVNEPPNIPTLQLTSAELGASVSDVNNWFAEGPWAVRVEVQRERFDTNADGKFTYTLKTWLKKCTDADCTNVVGTTFFQNTRFAYDWTTAGISPMTQVFDLSNSPDSFHDRFDRFLFGFTSASTASQTIEIRRFQLSFIRPNDPVASD